MSSDPPGLRASHEDRDRAVETLRVAAGDGRLTVEELETRLEAAITARTLGELAVLTADLPAVAATASAAKDVLVIEQHGGKYARTGRWAVPKRIELRPRLCQVTLDFTEALITFDTLRVDADMHLGKLFIVSTPGVVIDADGLTLAYSKLKLLPDDAGPASRLRIELVGTLRHGKVIERRPRRRRTTP